MIQREQDTGYDFAVIGAGINGLMIAHCLLRRHPTAKVVILEQFGRATPDEGSSHGLLRITRSVYSSTPEVRGMFRSLEEWRLLEAELSAQLIHFHPMCFFGSLDGAISDYVKAVEFVLGDIPDLAIRQIDVSEACKLYPQFRFEGNPVVLDDRTAGTILASATISRLAQRLTQAGVEMRYNTRVIELNRESDCYHINTSNGELRTRQLVVAAGPWMSEFVSSSGNPVIPIRQIVAYLGVKGLPTGTEIGEFPTWAHIGSGENSIHYGLPSHGGQGLKVARHVTSGPSADLETNVAEDRCNDASDLVEFVRRYLVVSDVELRQTENCLYTCRKDERFIVDWLDDSRRGIVVGAGNGHMFKWAPLIGRMVTDMLEEGQPTQVEARALQSFWSL